MSLIYDNMQDVDDKLLVHVNGLWWVRMYTKLEIDHKIQLSLW